MSVSTKSSASHLFMLLSGTSQDLAFGKPSDVFKLLEAAQPANYAVTLRRFERCMTRFAKACQRYEQGPQSLKQGLHARYLKPEYLNHMAQAVPDGNFMPIYFHNARWPFQFARQEEQQGNPYGNSVLSAMAQLRQQQASLLLQVRRVRHPVTKRDQELLVWNTQKIEANRALLQPLEPVRHSLRQQAIAAVKEITPQKANVIMIRQLVEPQAERLPLRAALLA